MNEAKFFADLEAALPEGWRVFNVGNYRPNAANRTVAYIKGVSDEIHTWLVYRPSAGYYVHYNGAPLDVMPTPQTAIAYWELTRGQT